MKLTKKEIIEIIKQEVKGVLAESLDDDDFGITFDQAHAPPVSAEEKIQKAIKTYKNSRGRREENYHFNSLATVLRVEMGYESKTAREEALAIKAKLDTETIETLVKQLLQKKQNKLTKEEITRIIEQEVVAVMYENDNFVKSVKEFVKTLRSKGRYWTRDRSNYGGIETNGYSIDQTVPGKTFDLKMVDGTKIKSQDFRVFLREINTFIEIPGLNTSGGSFSVDMEKNPAGKYFIMIMATVRDETKSRNKAFNNMGNQSYLAPVKTEIQEFPKDASGFAMQIIEAEKKFFEQVSSQAFMQRVIEKAGVEAEPEGRDAIMQKNYKLREAMLEAIKESASSVYGIEFNVAGQGA